VPDRRLHSPLLLPHLTRLLVVLVLAVLVHVRMGAQDVDHVRAPELTGKVERSLKALGEGGKRKRERERENMDH